MCKHMCRTHPGAGVSTDGEGSVEQVFRNSDLRGRTIQSNTSIAMVKATRSTSAVPSPTHNSLQCITASLYTSILPMRFCVRSTDNDWLALHASNSNLKKRPPSVHRRTPRSRRYNRLFGNGYRFPFRKRLVTELSWSRMAVARCDSCGKPERTKREYVFVAEPVDYPDFGQNHSTERWRLFCFRQATH
jgi:hypothetical protein